MAFNDHPEPSLEILYVSNADGFSNQAGYAIAPLVVQAFDDTGFAAAFVTWPMLPGSEPFGVSIIEVGIDQLAAITGGQRKP